MGFFPGGFYPDAGVLHPAWLKNSVPGTGVSRYNGNPIKAPFEPLNSIVLCDVRGFQGGLQLDPMTPADVSLSDNCKSDRCFSD